LKFYNSREDKKEEKSQRTTNLLEKFGFFFFFYLKTQNQFTAVLIQFLTDENTVSDCWKNSLENIVYDNYVFENIIVTKAVVHIKKNTHVINNLVCDNAKCV